VGLRHDYIRRLARATRKRPEHRTNRADAGRRFAAMVLQIRLGTADGSLYHTVARTTPTMDYFRANNGDSVARKHAAV